MASDVDILKDIPDAKPIRIFLPVKDSKERYRMQCVYQKTHSPHFNLLFQPGTLPVDSIDTGEPCILNVDLGGPNLSIEAMVTAIPNSQTLEMIVKKSITYDQMREFFRVDATAHVISKSFQPAFFGKKDESWALQGRTIDISGSGILATFSEKPPMDEQVRLEITLPSSPSEVVKILAHPVRVVQIDDDQWDVAFHFDDISDEDRDKIIGCCLIIQRRLLRLKVQVRDQVSL
ncbi:MAG: PilZ domain-containing protein [Desulfocapsaceae bacterium]|jgi:hypothetical protein|nr:PilZ domain-containing protein [Desulfocapsaceae bacterium]